MAFNKIKETIAALRNPKSQVERWLPANGKALSSDQKYMICIVELDFKSNSIFLHSLPDETILEICKTMNEKSA